MWKLSAKARRRYSWTLKPKNLTYCIFRIACTFEKYSSSNNDWQCSSKSSNSTCTNMGKHNYRPIQPTFLWGSHMKEMHSNEHHDNNFSTKFHVWVWINVFIESFFPSRELMSKLPCIVALYSWPFHKYDLELTYVSQASPVGSHLFLFH